MLRNVVAGLALLLFAMACRSNVDLDMRLRAELDRLDRDLKQIESSSTLPEALSSIPKAHRARLTAARAATSPDVRLVRMREAFIGIELLSLLQREPKAASELPALQALWTKERPRFEAKPADVPGPLLHRAMGQAAFNRAQKLFRASLPYAQSSEPLSGLFYLAEAEGNLRFRNFLASLPVASDSLSVPRDVVQADLGRLEIETQSKFRDDPSGRTSIRASAELKEARELFERGWVEGAALTLLQAGKVAEDDVPGALQLMTQMAATRATTEVAERLVTVTLVRWPYT
jgi:hypothetical protein